MKVLDNLSVEVGQRSTTSGFNLTLNSQIHWFPGEDSATCLYLSPNFSQVLHLTQTATSTRQTQRPKEEASIPSSTRHQPREPRG